MARRAGSGCERPLVAVRDPRCRFWRSMFMEIDVGILPDTGPAVKKTFTVRVKNFLTSVQLGSC